MVLLYALLTNRIITAMCMFVVGSVQTVTQSTCIGNMHAVDNVFYSVYSELVMSAAYNKQFKVLKQHYKLLMFALL